MPLPPAPGSMRYKLQAAVGVGVLLLGLLLAAGALAIPSAAGYGGAGPNFLPWVVAISLTICGAFIVREALTGGFRAADPSDDPAAAFWPGFVWMSAGLLANAALITTLGFIISCALCFVLAVQGLRAANGQMAQSARGWLRDALIGLAIAAPVFWVFTQFLAINLPGLTKTGWL